MNGGRRDTGGGPRTYVMRHCVTGGVTRAAGGGRRDMRNFQGIGRGRAVILLMPPSTSGGRAASEDQKVAGGVPVPVDTAVQIVLWVLRRRRTGGDR